ncbi:MAG: biotin/lipoyl-binding protein, partial [Nisaea sp.]|nr:biotin/lipoyl-binding protein [Nisaea sp.]
MVDNQDADNSPQTETTITKSSPRIGRLIVRIFLLVVIPVIAVVYGAQWYEKTGRFIETENAYIKTNVIAISADIDGRVTEVFVDENQIISKGDLLFKLDPNTYSVAIQMAESKREKVRQDISAMQAEYYQILAEIDEKKVNAAYKKADVANHKREARRQR